MLLVLALFVIARQPADRITENARPLSAPPLQPPSWDYPFGTDRQGRDLLAVMVAGTPLTLRIGFIAGFLGVGIGTVLAFTRRLLWRAGGRRHPRHRRYRADRARPAGAHHHRRLAEEQLSVNQMALVVASLAWLYPTRTIRSQVLTLRERGYVEVARLYGMGGLSIIFLELMPNLLPYLAATLVNAVSAGILASIGLEVLGLGPVDTDARHDALLGELQRRHDQWLVVVVDSRPPLSSSSVFLGLFFLTVGLDEIANPRLRRSL